MSIFDKIGKKRIEDDPQEHDDLQQYDDMQSEFEEDLFWEEFDKLGDPIDWDQEDWEQENWNLDDFNYEETAVDAAEGEADWYESESYDPEAFESEMPESESYEPAFDAVAAKKAALPLPFGLRSPDTLMILLCLILSVILLFFCGFLAVKTHALSDSNSKLEQRVQKDTKLKNSESEYESETENLESETDSLINSYGVGNTPEKTIMFLSNLSSTSGLTVTSIEFGESENVTVDENGKRLQGAAKAPDPTKASSSALKSNKEKNKKDKNSNQYYLYKYQVTFSYTGTYAQMKRAIEFIEDYGERTTVNDISSTYDDTVNNLTGSMTLNMYTLSGTTHEYKAPSVSGTLGNANIFG